MGFDFTSESGREFQLRSSAWSFFLYLAEGYGWVKHGTVAPRGVRREQWQGDYASNDGQYVTSEDASALADAYDRALDDPARQARAAESGRQLDRDVQELARRDGIELPPDDGEWSFDEQALRDFVEFLRAGGFRID